MASKHYDFKLGANLFNEVKVDEKFCLHSVARRIKTYNLNFGYVKCVF